MMSARLLIQKLSQKSSNLSLTSTRFFELRIATTATNATSQPPIDNLTIPPPSNVDKPASEKIEKLFNDISKLNLIEVSELSDLLKKRLNLSDISAMPMVGAVAAPVDDEDAEPVKVKTNFTVKLIKFEDKQKVALIKEIKSLMEGFNLVQAKKFVESAPALVKTDIPKEEADKLKEVLEKAGGVVEIS